MYLFIDFIKVFSGRMVAKAAVTKVMPAGAAAASVSTCSM